MYPNSFMITWTYEDVLDLAKHLNIALTDDEAREILYQVEHHHDASVGVNWLVIELAIDSFLEDKHGQSE